MNRQKLEQLGFSLPLLPTTSVGSLPKPPYLMQARGKFSKGAITRDELTKLEEQATEFWIRTQEEIGFDVLVDGEQYRGDMVAYFAEVMPGFEIGGLVRSYGNRYYHKPIIVSAVKWPNPITVDWWKFAQSLTEKPVKGMLTGPYTVMDWSFNEYYADRKTATIALAHEIRKEVEALVEAGAKIIQIDEPATSVRPEELPMMIEAMQILTEGLPVYFITHMCYGAFELIYPDLLKSPVDNFDLAISNSKLDLIKIFEKHPFARDISVGVVDVHSHLIEELATVKNRIQRALEVFPHESVWIDPDCGLKTRTVDEAIAKMKVLVEAAKFFRN